MTSFIIKAHENRPLHPQWSADPSCIFCAIIRGDAPAHKLYETDKVIAILDILPLRPGHALVIPKVHIPRVSELPDEFAAECGMAVSRVARAIASAVGNTGLNVVCNQEYAQAVNHVHYHIIPAPRPGESEDAERSDHVTRTLTQKEMHQLEFESRGSLEDESAKRLVDSIRARL
ncbi:HIT-like protein [Lenzites betulinus]|nr:HIT-like protein [Lenzites betulinus]